MKRDIESIVRTVLKYENTFGAFVKEIAYTPTNVHDVKNYTKHVGDLWEDFCCSYIRIFQGLTVYKLKMCPESILLHLHLKRKDVGIDLIGIDNEGQYFAVQCKYRKTCKALSWRDVSTFDALCMRSGPWKKCIIMTTSSRIQREGQISEKDVFIGNNVLSKLSKFDWMKLGDIADGYHCGGTKQENINEARLKYFQEQVVT